MNLFEIVKYGVSCREAAELYGVEVNRYGMALCPFHNDRHPSLYVADDHYYCFACGEHGDVIDFVGKLFQLSPYDAARKLMADFHLSPDKPPSAAALHAKRIRTEAQQLMENERLCFPLTTNVPYGYVKDPENPRRWVVDPVAADVVKRIFSMCMEGRGPKQIANQLKVDKVLTPSAYRALQGIKTPNKKPEDPCDWHSSTVVAILERREYTGCTVNFKTYTNSIWDKKQRDNPLEKQAIFPNTHEAIIEEAVFEKVQQVRQQRHRKTRTGRSSIFSGQVYCAAFHSHRKST